MQNSSSRTVDATCLVRRQTPRRFLDQAVISFRSSSRASSRRTRASSVSSYRAKGVWRWKASGRVGLAGKRREEPLGGQFGRTACVTRSSAVRPCTMTQNTRSATRSNCTSPDLLNTRLPVALKSWSAWPNCTWSVWPSLDACQWVRGFAALRRATDGAVAFCACLAAVRRRVWRMPASSLPHAAVPGTLRARCESTSTPAR